MGASRRAFVRPAAAALALWLIGCGEEPPADEVGPGAALADAAMPDGAAELPSALPDDPPMEMAPVPTDEGDGPCRVGTTRCLDQAVAQRCRRDGTWADLPCARGEECVPGPDRCLPVACEPGKSRCDGRWAEQACADNGRSWTLSRACDETEQCLGGLCRVCQPNFAQCTSANTRRRCSPDGTAWLPDEACETNLCFDGACLVCVPDEGQCVDEATVRVCRADGMGLGEPQVCPEGQRCRGGRCLDRCRTRTLVLVDDARSMQPHLPAVQTVLAEMVESGDFELAFMSARARAGCGGGVAPPQVPFSASPEDALAWLDGLDAEGSSQITDIATWYQQNKRIVWGQDALGYVVILTAGGDTCGPEGSPGRVSWNEATYENLGGRLRRSGVRLKTLNVGGLMDRQLDRLSICNGNGPAVDLDLLETLTDDLREALRGVLLDIDVCAI